MENKEKVLEKSLEEITAVGIKNLKTEIKSINENDIVLGFTIEDKIVEKVEGTFSYKEFGEEKDSESLPEKEESSEEDSDGQAQGGEEATTFTQSVIETVENLTLTEGNKSKNEWNLKGLDKGGLYKGDVKVSIYGKEETYRVTLRKINEEKKVSIEGIKIEGSGASNVGDQEVSQDDGGVENSGQAVALESKTYTITLSSIKINGTLLNNKIVELKSEKYGIIKKQEKVKNSNTYEFTINKEIEDKEIFDVIIKNPSEEKEKSEDIIVTTQIILIKSEESGVQTFGGENPNKIEGKQVSSSFKSTGVNTGELSINDKSILTKLEPDSKKWSTILKLNSGSIQNITLKNEDSPKEGKNEALFIITFNGKTPMGKISWSFGKLKGETYNPIIEALNFVNNPKIVRNGSSFRLEVKFNDLIPAGEKIELINDGKIIDSEKITIDNFKTGNYILKSNVKTGNYRGAYEAGINVNINPIGITIRDNKLNVVGSAEVLIETSFFDEKDKQNVKGGSLKYKEKGSSGDFIEINLSSEEVKQKYLVKRVEGLREGIYYEFLAQYLCVNKEKQEAESLVRIFSNTIEILIPKKQDENKKDEIKIEVDKENSEQIEDGISIKIPSNISIDKEKNIEAGVFKYKDKNGNIVTQSKEEFSNVTVKFEGEKMIIDGLVPGKKYDEITVDYVDKDGKIKSLTLKDIVVEPQSKLDEYLPNVYDSVFSREADEAGYHYHLDRLESGETSIRDFLRSIIDGEEFGQNKDLGEKVDDLYSAIVGRDSDEEGKKFWMEEYNKTLNECGSDKEALKIIVDRMVNENELKEIAEKLDVKW